MKYALVMIFGFTLFFNNGKISQTQMEYETLENCLSVMKWFRKMYDTENKTLYGGFSHFGVCVPDNEEIERMKFEGEI